MIRFLIQLEISINVPSGQMVEQYTLPNRVVRTIMIAKPTTETDKTEIKFRKEGIN